MRTGLPTDRAAFIEVDEELMQVAIDTYVRMYICWKAKKKSYCLLPLQYQ